jgi:O-antigen ligase
VLGVAALVAVTLLVPPPWVLAGGLTVVMSPISRDGTQLLSTAATMFFAASLALGVILSGRWRSAWAAVPRGARRAQIGLLALLLLSAGIGLAEGHSPRLVAWDLEPFFEFAAFAWLGLAVLRDAADRRRIVATLIAVGGLKAGYDLIVFIRGFTPQLQAAGLDGFLANRVLDPGPMLALPLAFLWMLHAGRPSWRSWWPLLSIALILPLLVISFTRSYWLGFVLAAILVVFAERGTILRRSAIIAGVGAVAIAVGAVVAPHGPIRHAVDLVQKRIAYTSEQVSSSATPLQRRRQDETKDALNAALDGHLLGAQAGSLVPIKFAQKTNEVQDTAGFHNWFLQVLFKIGALGLILFLWLIGACIWAMWRARRASRGWDRVVVLGALAVWLMESVQLLLNPETVSFHIPAIMGALCAAALAAGTPGRTA